MTVVLVGTRVIVSSFVDGTRVVEPKYRETETDVLARALWLASHVGNEQADEYLENYLRRNSAVTRH